MKKLDVTERLAIVVAIRKAVPKGELEIHQLLTKVYNELKKQKTTSERHQHIPVMLLLINAQYLRNALAKLHVDDAVILMAIDLVKSFNTELNLIRGDKHE